MLASQLAGKPLGASPWALGVQDVAFVEELRRAAVLGRGAGQGGHTTSAQLNEPWVELLRKIEAEALARAEDPWMLRLERVQGEVGYDGVERISTQSLFDHLEVPQRGRTAGACRRLAKLMRELGWSSMKARGLGQSGFRDQVRGYAREGKR
jgi:hypothetical protein